MSAKPNNPGDRVETSSTAAEWLRNGTILEVNTWAWIQQFTDASGRRLTLGELPEEAWDELVRTKASAVWLMGVWTRSKKGVALSLKNKWLIDELRNAFPDLKDAEVIGSPYCVQKFETDSRLGGDAGLACARVKLRERGVRLILDFVPNHLALDHEWVAAHPEWFIRGTKEDLVHSPHDYVEVNEQVFAFGKDPNLPAWCDVLQLNAFNPDQRRGAISALKKMATQCDAVRCDMAMLLLNDVFSKTWRHRVGAAPEMDYWTAVISEIKREHPNFRFLAEAYWGLEPALLEQGFDACYDKVFYDRLLDDSVTSFRQHLIDSAAVQDRLIRFLENHDEPRVAAILGQPKVLAALVILMTLPGIRLIHEGQLDGKKIKMPLHVARSPSEQIDPAVAKWFSWITEFSERSNFRDGIWSQCRTGPVDDGSVLSWCWKIQSQYYLIAINYDAAPSRGWVELPSGDEKLFVEEDYRDLVLHGTRGELHNGRIEVDLKPWEFRMLKIRQT